MRKLASIRKVSDIQPIPDADRICVYVIDGWKVVDSIGKYNIGDLIVYIEPDGFVPNSLCPFLSKGNEPKEYNGIKGERLRTIKLKKTLSQGLILPLYPTCDNIDSMLFEGLDVTIPLGIQLYEPPVPACLAGTVKGNFPSRIPKTSQERIQNLVTDFNEWKELDYRFECSEKADGSSMTCYIIDDEFGVCSRNLDLKLDENNTFWKVAIQNLFERKLRLLNKNIAIQGEMIGNGVNNNLYKLTDHRFMLFDVYDIDAGRYYSSRERIELAESLDIDHVPIIDIMNLNAFNTVDELLEFADGKSIINPDVNREGLVFKCVENPDVHFKAISNRYLIKNGY